MIDRLRRVPLREVWKHEALDFTPWLERNADVLAETLGFEISGVEREKQVGVLGSGLAMTQERWGQVLQ